MPLRPDGERNRVLGNPSPPGKALERRSRKVLLALIVAAVAYLWKHPRSAIVAALCMGGMWKLVMITYQRMISSARVRLLAAMAKEKRQARDTRREQLRSLVGDVDPELRRRVCESTAGQLLSLMRDRTFTCEQVTRAFCSRALEAGELLNCNAEEAYDEAIMTAKKIDTVRASPNHDLSTEPPLFGLPVSIKDQINMIGYDSTCGTAARCFAPADADAALVRVLRDAGAIPFVRSNVPQSLLIQESTNAIWGTALNPWNLDRTPSGSSGGEGALVGARASPLGIGTDIGGSIRGPAFNNGVCGLKPTVGRVSVSGLSKPRVDDRLGQLAIKGVAGPLAQCVDDLALAMRVLLDPVVKAQHDCRVHGSPFNEAEFTSTRPLTIGILESDSYFPACPTSRRAVREAKAALQAAGHRVVNITTEKFRPGSSTRVSNPSSYRHADAAGPEGDPLVFPNADIAFRIFARLIGAEGKMRNMVAGLYGEQLLPHYRMSYLYSTIPSFLRPPIGFILRHVLGEPRKADLLLERPTDMKVVDYFAACANMKAYQQRWDAAWRANKIDALVLPGLPMPAMRHKSFNELVTMASYTTWFNLLDYPGGVVPVTVVREDEQMYEPSCADDSIDRLAEAEMRDTKGLPVGVQVVAPPGLDERVLRVMKDVESQIRFRSHHAPTAIPSP